MPEQSRVSIQRMADATLMVRLSGRWRLRGGLPSASLIERMCRFQLVARQLLPFRCILSNLAKRGFYERTTFYIDDYSGGCFSLEHLTLPLVFF